MFSIADIVTTTLLREAFDHIAKNPHELEFILCAYSRKDIRDIVGDRYIKQCVEMVSNNRFNITPYYEANLENFPSLVVVSQGSEGETFIGDKGRDIHVSKNEPIKYASFKASEVSEKSIIVPNSKEELNFFRGLILDNESDEFGPYSIESVIQEANSTVICIDGELPSGAPLTGWFTRTDGTNKRYSLSSSIDNVTVQIKLTTNGDYAVHRLFSIVTRWALKYSRFRFERYGLQVPKFSYGPPMGIDDSQLIYETVFTFQSQAPDHWIEYQYDTIDKTSALSAETIAVSDSEQNEDVEVK